MNKIKIITDSCCSLSISRLKELDVDYVQMNIMIDDNIYDSFDYPTKDFNMFYKELETAKKCSTGCVNTQSFIDIFEKYVKNGYDVVYMGLSGGLSCTYHNALSAANEINQTYGKHVWVADTLTGSYGIALDVEHAVKMVSEGKSAQQIFEAIDKNALNLFSIFVPGDLQFLTRSGRLNAIVATVGTMLKLMPIIIADDKGKLKTVAKCLGRKKAIKTLQNYVVDFLDENLPETIYIGHTGQLELANEMAEIIKQNTKNKNVIVDYIDYTMSCCCGPNTIAIFGLNKNK